MKEIAAEHQDRDRLKKLRAERRAARDKQMVVPDQTSANYERQLKKLATRGVVALFNAIAKSKRDAAEIAAAAMASKEKEVAHVGKSVDSEAPAYMYRCSDSRYIVRIIVSSVHDQNIQTRRYRDWM